MKKLLDEMEKNENKDDMTYRIVSLRDSDARTVHMPGYPELVYYNCYP